MPGPLPSEQESSLLSIPAQLDSCSTFTLTHERYSKGNIQQSQHIQMLQAILDEPTVRLQVSCVLENEDGEKANKRIRSTSRIIPCSLSFTLYGPLSLSEELGTFFQSYDIYLQTRAIVTGKSSTATLIVSHRLISHRCR